MSKTVELKSALIVFASKELQKSLMTLQELTAPEAEELVKMKEFFGTEDVAGGQGTFTLKLEEFLWKLFESVPAPTSPLRLKAHERSMLALAEKLRATLETETLPSLTKEELQQIVKFVEDPVEFERFQFDFEYRLPGTETVRRLPLPSVNVLGAQEFLGTLETMFEGVTSNG
jgi:hypothetical protein